MTGARLDASLLVSLVATLAALCSGCDRSLYVVDGVTDGTRFYVLPQQLEDESPVTQSWIAYSLARSACQLREGGDLPSRYSAFDCELAAREALVTSWRAYRAADTTDGTAATAARVAGDTVGDEYLDTLAAVSDAGFLREYVWHYLRERQWQMPQGLGMESFDAWRRLVLADHEAQTRLIGAWI